MLTVTDFCYFAAAVTVVILLGVVIAQAKANPGVKSGGERRGHR